MAGNGLDPMIWGDGGDNYDEPSKCIMNSDTEANCSDCHDMNCPVHLGYQSEPNG